MSKNVPSLITAMITASLTTFSVDMIDTTTIVTAYSSLLEANKGNHQQTRQMFNKLMVEASDQTEPISWLKNELHWETQASVLGSRKLAAMNDLETSGGITDELLDRYNQRTNR